MSPPRHQHHVDTSSPTTRGGETSFALPLVRDLLSSLALDVREPSLSTKSLIRSRAITLILCHFTISMGGGRSPALLTTCCRGHRTASLMAAEDATRAAKLEHPYAALASKRATEYEEFKRLTAERAAACAEIAQLTDELSQCVAGFQIKLEDALQGLLDTLVNCLSQTDGDTLNASINEMDDDNDEPSPEPSTMPSPHHETRLIPTVYKIPVAPSKKSRFRSSHCRGRPLCMGG
eukprot:CAMPEP_0183708858 /NCGR_PEP_ID=MMETSP0737-20130205/5039_1 /TAXON_ID=385413 /ORGANISM="Thalassiosira miniscula, Strain CCMP1093" /LENGTH=234 /DNA_ID=CAMNT_0025936809 /DNA_START=172 /DNA_END=873 /DNA_ORIENTATION=+